jgi:hypothetical protein
MHLRRILLGGFCNFSHCSTPPHISLGLVSATASATSLSREACVKVPTTLSLIFYSAFGDKLLPRDSLNSTARRYITEMVWLRH